MLAEKYKHETELKGLTKEYRRHNDIVNTLRKLIDQDKKIYKKEERQRDLNNDLIREKEMIIDKYKKEEQEFAYEMDK